MILDYLRRVLIVMILALCVSIIFFTGRAAKAADHTEITINTSHWIFPVKGYITDSFGTRHGHHKGIDIGGEIGENIYSVDRGIVTKSYYSSTYGHVVFVRHENGFETVYAHLQNRLVDEGDEVNQGDVVGIMGSTGRSTGAHLHFEIHNGEWTIEKEHAIDPYVVFGEGEIGQEVFSKEHDPYRTVELALRYEKEKTSKEELSKDYADLQKHEPFLKVSEIYETTKEESHSKEALSSTFRKEANQVSSKPRIQNKEYIVQKGDTLSQIAEINGVSVYQLLELNTGLQNKDLIIPKQILIVRRE